MQEITRNEALEQPNSKEVTFNQEAEATTPAAAENTAFLEVKFNKEIKNLRLEEATSLAQKGMKLDQISNELETLQGLAKEKGQGLREFVNSLLKEKSKTKLSDFREKYSEDKELCELLSKMEENKEAPFEEFPDITPNSIPQEVKDAAEKSEKGLLFEYLLYEFRKKRAEENEAARQEKSRAESLGSISLGAGGATADAEFLRGIWGN